MRPNSAALSSKIGALKGELHGLRQDLYPPAAEASAVSDTSRVAVGGEPEPSNSAATMRPGTPSAPAASPQRATSAPKHLQPLAAPPAAAAIPMEGEAHQEVPVCPVLVLVLTAARRSDRVAGGTKPQHRPSFVPQALVTAAGRRIGSAERNQKKG
jgi:hypothetical protein